MRKDFVQVQNTKAYYFLMLACLISIYFKPITEIDLKDMECLAFLASFCTAKLNIAALEKLNTHYCSAFVKQQILKTF